MGKPLDAHPRLTETTPQGQPGHVRLFRARHMGAETKGPRKENTVFEKRAIAGTRRHADGTTDGNWTWLQRWRSAGIRGLGLLNIAFYHSHWAVATLLPKRTREVALLFTLYSFDPCHPALRLSGGGCGAGGPMTLQRSAANTGKEWSAKKPRRRLLRVGGFASPRLSSPF